VHRPRPTHAGGRPRAATGRGPSAARRVVRSPERLQQPSGGGECFASSHFSTNPLSRGETCAHFLVHGWSPSPATGGAGRGFALVLGSPHASAWPWPSNTVAAPTACDLGTSGSTFSNRACDAHRLSRVNVRAQPSRESTHLCVPAARTDAALRLFARWLPGRRRFSPTGLPRATTDLEARFWKARDSFIQEVTPRAPTRLRKPAVGRPEYGYPCGNSHGYHGITM
jgi:hypothetical protein